MIRTGTLEQDGDRWRLRYERTLGHGAERVWQALTDQEDLRAWFPSRIEGEWAVAAPLRFVHAGEMDIPASEGRVLACDPPRLLEYTWYGDTLRFELTPQDDGACRLALIVTFDELGKAARDGAGWHECLDLLATSLDGGDTWALGSRWKELQPAYAEALGPDAATIGPPEGWKEPQR